MSIVGYCNGLYRIGAGIVLTLSIAKHTYRLWIRCVNHYQRSMPCIVVDEYRIILTGMAKGKSILPDGWLNGGLGFGIRFGASVRAWYKYHNPHNKHYSEKISSIYVVLFVPSNQYSPLDYVIKKLYLCYAINVWFKRLNESEMKAVNQSER